MGDTRSETTDLAQDLGSHCDQNINYAYTGYPQIGQTPAGHNRCGYRRGWTYEASCSWITQPEQFRFCPCGSTWFKSAGGASCDDTCSAQGAGACNENMLEHLDTPDEVRAVALELGTPCNDAMAMFEQE